MSQKLLIEVYCEIHFFKSSHTSAVANMSGCDVGDIVPVHYAVIFMVSCCGEFLLV